MRRSKRYRLTYNTRKKNPFLGILIALSGIGVISTLALVGGIFVLNSQINGNQKAIEALSNEVTASKEQIKKIQSQEKEYKSQLETIEEELTKYQPIIIPDSMKEQ